MRTAGHPQRSFWAILSAIAWLLLCPHAAPGGQAKPPGPTFLAGAATSNITPELGSTLTMASFATSKARHVHDELWARCLVLDDSATRLAFVICDTLAMSKTVSDEAKRLIAAETGIPSSHVITAAVHTHSAMSTRSEEPPWSDGSPGPYEHFLARRMADGVRRAINNLVPARIAWGRGELAGQVFNRRWRVRNPDDRRNPYGGVDQVRMNPTAGSPDLIEPAGPTDPEILFLSVQTAGGAPLALLANYSLHYVAGVPGGVVSADYFGAFADRIRELLETDRVDPPFVGILTNGASGDINNIDFRQPRERREPFEKIRLVADQVASEVFRASRHLKHHDWVKLDVAYLELNLEGRRPSPEMVARAREVLDRPASEQRYHPRERYYAGRTLALAENPETIVFPLQAGRIGDFGIFTLPAEAFVEIGLELKARSLLRPAMVMGLANGYFGYLPTPRHHELGGYETWLGTNRAKVNASVQVIDALLHMQRALELPPAAPSVSHHNSRP